MAPFYDFIDDRGWWIQIKYLSNQSLPGNKDPQKMVIKSERSHDLGGRETPTIIFISTPSLFGVKGETIGDDSEATGKKPGLL